VLNVGVWEDEARGLGGFSRGGVETPTRRYMYDTAIAFHLLVLRTYSLKGAHARKLLSFPTARCPPPPSLLLPPGVRASSRRRRERRGDAAPCRGWGVRRKRQPPRKGGRPLRGADQRRGRFRRRDGTVAAKQATESRRGVIERRAGLRFLAGRFVCSEETMLHFGARRKLFSLAAFACAVLSALLMVRARLTFGSLDGSHVMFDSKSHISRVTFRTDKDVFVWGWGNEWVVVRLSSPGARRGITLLLLYHRVCVYFPPGGLRGKESRAV